MKKNKTSMRELSFEINYTSQPMGSVLVSFGETKVLCTVMVEEGVPKFVTEENQAWLTAEYSMLPGSTLVRKQRRKIGGEMDGRSVEIGRLIGRSLRAGIDLRDMGSFTIYIDCDVLQADGGTRTAAISGAYLALRVAIQHMIEKGLIRENPIERHIAAVSVGIVDGEMALDLCFHEDARADVDMNVIMDHEGNFIEIQGSSEKKVFSREQLDALLDLASSGVKQVFEEQEKVFDEMYLRY